MDSLTKDSDTQEEVPTSLLVDQGPDQDVRQEASLAGQSTLVEVPFNFIEVPPTADYGPPIVDYGLPTADYALPTADYRPPTANC